MEGLRLRKHEHCLQCQLAVTYDVTVALPYFAMERIYISAHCYVARSTECHAWREQSYEKRCHVESPTYSTNMIQEPESEELWGMGSLKLKLLIILLISVHRSDFQFFFWSKEFKSVFWIKIYNFIPQKLYMYIWLCEWKEKNKIEISIWEH